MNLLFENFKKNKIKFILNSVSFVIALITLILYLTTGIIKGFTDDYSISLIVFLVIGIIINGFALFKRITIIGAIPFILYVISLLFFVVNSNYLVAVIRAIDVTSVSLSFVFTVILFIIAFICDILGVGFNKKY